MKKGGRCSNIVEINEKKCVFSITRNCSFINTCLFRADEVDLDS